MAAARWRPFRIVGAAALVCLLLVTSSACETERAPEGITCDKLRALRVGMTIEEARDLLPPAAEVYVKDAHTVIGGPPGADTTWLWSGNGSGVRLQLFFGHGRLLEASSWIRTMWRDVFDNESRPSLFVLEASHSAQEGQDFKRVYCP
jgi:hypothetical protein